MFILVWYLHYFAIYYGFARKLLVLKSLILEQNLWNFFP